MADESPVITSELAREVRAPLRDDNNKEFEKRVSAAKSEIGAGQLSLADKFNKCVLISTGLRDFTYGDFSEPKVRSGGALIDTDKAHDLLNIATAQCAAKIYGGPGGMGGN